MEKNIVYILKPCREIGQRFEERLRQQKLLDNLEIFRMNDETTFKFEFLMV